MSPAGTRWRSLRGSARLAAVVRHILLLQQRPDATADEIDACRTALAGLIGAIPGLRDFHWGVNFAPVERRGGFSHGFSMDFDDRASLDAYGPHPQHQVAAAKVRATFERIVVFDFEL
jgi:Stress responsive A/B Barrel Domain